MHIATDGESYGHHHRFGEMALAYALRKVEPSGTVSLTNYASFLAKNPPKDEAPIVVQSSWSCAHGLGRCSTDCGCKMRGASNQAWRGPLREALDFVADVLDRMFERDAAPLVRDPWAARDSFIDVVLDRSPGSVDAFMSGAGAASGAAERRRVLSLMEMQRNRVLMYTSCGWFFDDVSGIETAQILQYAVRAIDRLDEPALGFEIGLAMERTCEALERDPASDAASGASTIWSPLRAGSPSSSTCPARKT